MATATAYPSPQEFREILLSTEPDDVAKRHVFDGTAYAFRSRPKAFVLLRSHLSESLGVTEENIVVVGSAKIGFSLSPDNFPRRFNPFSDIDVVVVDEELFDRVWMTILDWNYPLGRLKMLAVDRVWTSRRRSDLYWGWFRPDRIRFTGLSLPQALAPIRDISTGWFNAFQGLSRYPEFAQRQISGRLYRTWGHALRYHADGLRQIADALRTQMAGS